MWGVCIVLSIIALVASLLLVVFKINPINRSRLTRPLPVAIAGFFVSAMILFFPICYMQYAEEFGGVLIAVLAAVHSTVKLFVVDSDFAMISDAITGIDANLKNTYELLGAVLIAVSPLLTFSVVLSFFKNALSYQKYLFGFFKEAYIFSEINEKSLALAESLRESDKKCLLIFNDVFESEEERSFELGSRVDAIGGICFKKDIVSIDYRVHSRKKQIFFFVMGEDETENVAQSLKLIEKYHDYENVRIDVFAKTAEAELLLQTKDKGKIKMVRRNNDVRSLISRILYETGIEIFRHNQMKDDKKMISAIVVGLGNHGMEMAKALTWFCQMTGYTFEMHIFEKDEHAEEKFRMSCPDLLNTKYNGQIIDGEPDYTICVHSGIDVNTYSFRKELEKIEAPSYVFVALGNDAQNVHTAIDIRAFYAMKEFQPRIQAVLYNSGEKEALYKAKYNNSGATKQYEIEFLGDIKTSYSKDVILRSEVEVKAKERHLLWDAEHLFWDYEYNYRSSLASAIHHKMKIELGIPYADVPPEKRPYEERELLRKLEHCRWSAYVRSEGYTFGEVRNDLAKKHPCLIPYEQLSEKDKEKDDV